MSENDFNVGNMRQQLKNLIQYKKARQIVKMVAEVIIQKIIPDVTIYDLIGELLV